jgi:hypothetical protein
MNEIEELNKQIEELNRWKNNLQSSSTIPINIDKAFRGRFGELAGITTSSKSSSSENKAVNEEGSSSYNVLLPPDVFLEITINGTKYYIPAYT